MASSRVLLVLAGLQVLDKVCQLERHCDARRHGRVVCATTASAPDLERCVNSILACVEALAPDDGEVVELHI
jgi:hypothetical protein